MNHQPLSFVLLFYLPNPDENPEDRIAILVQQDGAELDIVITSGWEKSLKAEDREYLTGLMSDWRSTPFEEIPGLLQQLSELSIGSLRAVESGILDSRKRTALVNQIELGK